MLPPEEVEAAKQRVAEKRLSKKEILANRQSMVRDMTNVERQNGPGL